MKIIPILLVLLFTLFGCSNNLQNSNENFENANSNFETKRLSNLPPEEDLASFSTVIYIKEEDRQKNIQIACNQLNGTIVRAGETFSFCNTLGPANPENGYKKADTFDSDGDIIQEYGGGKCQISSTLYNAVLQIPTLSVIERHSHSRKVNYVEEGKDAAIAYGSIDFKFRNDNNYDIKIYSTASTDNIDIRIVKLNS